MAFQISQQKRIGGTRVEKHCCAIQNELKKKVKLGETNFLRLWEKKIVLVNEMFWIPTLWQVMTSFWGQAWKKTELFQRKVLKKLIFRLRLIFSHSNKNLFELLSQNNCSTFIFLLPKFFLKRLAHITKHIHQKSSLI